jgi:hypothetical protein
MSSNIDDNKDVNNNNKTANNSNINDNTRKGQTKFLTTLVNLVVVVV